MKRTPTTDTDRLDWLVGLITDATPGGAVTFTRTSGHEITIPADDVRTWLSELHQRREAAR